MQTSETQTTKTHMSKDEALKTHNDLMYDILRTHAEAGSDGCFDGCWHAHERYILFESRVLRPGDKFRQVASSIEIHDAVREVMDAFPLRYLEELLTSWANTHYAECPSDCFPTHNRGICGPARAKAEKHMAKLRNNGVPKYEVDNIIRIVKESTINESLPSLA